MAWGVGTAGHGLTLNRTRVYRAQGLIEDSSHFLVIFAAPAMAFIVSIERSMAKPLERIEAHTPSLGAAEPHAGDGQQTAEDGGGDVALGSRR